MSRPQPQNDGAVRCPRKGPTADAIAWAKCVDMNERSPHACAEQGCRQITVSALAIEVRAQIGSVPPSPRTTVRGRLKLVNDGFAD